MYLAELDAHFPELTTRQTLDFGISVSLTEGRSALPSSDTLASQFNLSRAMSTNVGNSLIPGISGGERRRLSIAEAFAKGSSLQCYDNCTRGLDSATALSLVNSLRLSAKYLGTTAVATIYQASQEIYDVSHPPLRMLKLSMKDF